MKRIGVLIFAIATTACEPADKPKPIQKLVWRDAPGGGVFTSIEEGNAERPYSLGARCWKGEERFNCIFATVGIAGLGDISLSVTQRETLPDNELGLMGAHGAGYSCHYNNVGGLLESIKSDGGTLKSNSSMDNEPPWSKRDVNDYMAANNIDGLPYFNCPAVVRAIRDGSIATLGSTSITKKMAGL